METIEKLIKVASILEGSVFDLRINGFNIQYYTNNGANLSGLVAFKMELSNIHINQLILLGIDFNFRSKIKSNNQNGNDYIINACASVFTLNILDKYLRYNHLYKASMMGLHQLVASGFYIKGVKMGTNGRLEYGYNFPKTEKLLCHFDKINKIKGRIIKKRARRVAASVFNCLKSIKR